MTEASDMQAGDARALADLLLAVAGGDGHAFERLYQSTSARLFGICLRLVQQRSDAEDVLQEVYTTIWRKSAQFDAAKASAMTWLSMLARNKSIDRLRATRNDKNALPIDFAGDLRDPDASVDAATESGEQRRRLDACMDELESQRRTLIRTAFFEGATYEELATRSGAPLGTVKSWIRRSLMRLRACLER